MKLTADIVEAFSGAYLSSRYDDPKKIPPFHRQCWELYCSDTRQAGVAAPRNHAKAQPLDEPVLTPEGWKTIGDLKIGDLIIGSNGKASQVVDLHPIESLETYKITTKDGRSTRCNKNHLWSVYVPSNTGTKLVTMSFDQLRKIAFRTRKDGYPEYRAYLPLPDPIEFSISPKLPLDPYVLGVWLGDGASASGCIYSDDPEIFNYFSYEVQRKSAPFKYRVVGLTSDLRQLGVLNNKHVPDTYLQSSIQDRLNLLQGLMDTDGTVHQDGKIGYFCNTNRQIIDSLVYLVRSLGGVAHISETVDAPGATMTSWRVSVKLPSNMNAFRLTRKANKYQSSCNKIAITKIEQVQDTPARCISVASSDGLYITKDFILTHNTSALTFAYTLTEVLFRSSSYVIIISATEREASGFASNIYDELRTNSHLINRFGPFVFETDSKLDVIVRCKDGHRFRISVRGAEQSIRGLMWNGMRPDLIIGDDMETDEQTESKTRREKFSRWFYRAAKQALSRRGRIRVHGTILHEDSFLARVMKSSAWETLFFKAHESFDDFSNILWPEQWSEEALRSEQQVFIQNQDSAGYSQEYLNNPMDNDETYLRRVDFLPMSEDEYSYPLILGVGADFAITKANKNNRTSFTIGGKAVNNLLYFIDQRVGRWDSLEIVDEMFLIQQRWNPDFFWVEDGVIWKGLAPMLYKEMQIRNIWINLIPRYPVKDKATRGRSFQRRMRAGGCKFDKSADWYPGFEEELLRFTGYGEAALDDQFDSAALLSLGFDDAALVEKEDFLTDEEEEFERQDPRKSLGRNPITGY